MLRGPFRFDAAAHRYTVGDFPVPGIHAVLRADGVERGGPWFTDEHQDRGLCVHRATLAHDLGRVVHMPAEWRGYFDAYLALLGTVDCRWTLLEHPRVHRRLKCATVLDRVGRVNGRWAVVELKTGSPAPWHGVQLAGAHLIYCAPATIDELSSHARIAFYLQQDGRFAVREYCDRMDYHRFMQAIHRYWKSSGNGIASQIRA